MSSLSLLSTVSILIISVLAILFIRARVEIADLKHKYSRITDIEAERNTIVKEIKKIFGRKR